MLNTPNTSGLKHFHHTSAALRIDAPGLSSDITSTMAGILSQTALRGMTRLSATGARMGPIARNAPLKVQSGRFNAHQDALVMGAGVRSGTTTAFAVARAAAANAASGGGGANHFEEDHCGATGVACDNKITQEIGFYESSCCGSMSW